MDTEKFDRLEPTLSSRLRFRDGDDSDVEGLRLDSDGGGGGSIAVGGRRAGIGRVVDMA